MDIQKEEEHKELSVEEVKFKMIQDEFYKGIDAVSKFNPSVTFYGSTHLDEKSEYYQKVKHLAYRIAKELGYAVLSGGGPGIMEAANKGAYEAGGKSVGLTIKLPEEQLSNKYLTNEIPFHYFFTRQSSMSFSTEVCIFCPGGYGTLNELFEILTLEQTNKIGRIPVILFCSEFWKPLEKLTNEILLERFHTIAKEDTQIYTIMDDEDEILNMIKNSKMRYGDDSLI
ncbi:MAG TPA: TIGR00730 family Rossman fold protein [Candidatus Paceibacterota bacterium]|nr:TIGR00730 family Rossman fold protein [Candidatus Paceibacterota bacterium]